MDLLNKIHNTTLFLLDQYTLFMKISRLQSSGIRRTLLISLLCVFFVLTGCKNQQPVAPDPSFSAYISAYTSGMIANESPIRIILANDLSEINMDEKQAGKLFSFSPSISGKAMWKSSREIVFIPDSGSMKQGTLYNAEFNLGKIMDVDKDHRSFPFSFQIIEQNFSIETNGYIQIGNNPEWNALTGEILLADKASPELIQKMLTADINNKKLKVSVNQGMSARQYTFTVDSIRRTSNDEILEIQANGKSIGTKKRWAKKIEIPALDKFKVLSCRYVQAENSYVELFFSDALSTTQKLSDYIYLSGISNQVLQHEKNRVRIYFQPNSNITSINVNIGKGLMNQDNKGLNAGKTITLNITSQNPRVALLNKGNIMPNSDKLIFPFKAINLRSVSLSVIKIYENNILRFLQSNMFDGTNDLRSAGRIVYRKKINLSGDNALDLSRWNDFSVDLSPLVKKDPGAMYRIVLTFDKSDAILPCNQAEGDYDGQLTQLSSESGITEADEEYWDTPYGYYSPVEYNWNEYVWEDRNNPCTPTYYMNNDIFAGCNILSSNLGIIAEGGSGKSYSVIVNNILSTQPEKDVKVTLYNFQLQPVGEGTTDENGFAEVSFKGGKPFVLTVAKDKEKGYLKLDDASALSYSRFDVGGKEIRKGLKGYIYTERGVWRPGDSIYVGFILNDKANPLPKGHPVVFEMYTPTGKFFKKMVSTDGLNGFYTFKTATEPNAPTGRWEAYVKVGGVNFAKTIRIEAIKPNRLKIDLNTNSDIISASKKEQSMSIKSAWLMGMPASNLKASVELKLSATNGNFKQFPKYTFLNPAITFDNLSQTIFEGKLNAQGDANFMAKLPAAPNAPGMLNANFISRVYEDGGDFSTYIQTFPYSPFTSYAGIEIVGLGQDQTLTTDTKNKINIVTVNDKGQPVESEVELSIYKLDWRWWWEKDNSSLASYMSSVNKQELSRVTYKTGANPVSKTFEIKYPQWGRFLIYVKDLRSGHATGKVVYMDWPEWRGQAAMQDPDGITMLNFTTDKATYKVGEVMKVTLPKASAGRALVSVENGSQVLDKRWIETKAGKETQFELPVTDAMAPNVYIHITMLQPYGQKDNDLPIRLYGIQPVTVENQKTHLEPQISMPATLKPEQTFTVNVNEKSGDEMTYTLAIVDEGLLDLTAFRTPNPWPDFYTREALGVRTWDVYNWVMGAYAGSLNQLLSIGGDQELKNTSRNNANRFKPVVRFMGPFYLGKNKKASHKIKLPAYVGAVRVMVVAGNQSGAYGNCEKSVEVKNSIMTLSTLPRIAAPEDEMWLPVNLFVTEKGISSVSVSVKTKNGILNISGNASQQVSVKAPADKVLFFKLKAGVKCGTEVVSITSKTGNETFTETIELNVSNPNLPVVTTLQKSLPANESGSMNWNFPAESTNRSVSLSVSGMPGINLAARLNYLIGYPHGCAEQIISKAYPQLYLSSLVPLNEQESKEMKSSVQNAIQKVYGLQMANGGFTYWQGGKTSDSWVTSYAGAFLTEAKNKGYDISANVLSKWLEYQKQASRNWDPEGSRYTQMGQAYRLYTMALANAPDLSGMNRLRGLSNLSNEARWMLAYTFAISGRDAVCKEILAEANTAFNRESNFGFDFGSELRDESIALLTLIQINDIKEAQPLAMRIASQLSSDQQYSTQATSFALMSMAEYAKKTGNGPLNFTWQTDKNKSAKVESVYPMWQTEIKNAGKTGSLSVKNNGKGVLFTQLIQSYIPLFDNTPAVNNGLSLKVSYVLANGTQTNIQSMMQGTNFTMIAEVTNTSSATDYTNLALNEVFPAGWENLSTRYAGISEMKSDYDYQDIRDDRVSTFFSLKKGETKRFIIRLQAAYAGKFYMPAIQCEAMYDATVTARTKAQEVNITRE